MRKVRAVKSGPAPGEAAFSDRPPQEWVADGLVDVAVDRRVVDREGGSAPPARPPRIEPARRLAFAFGTPGSEWEAWHEEEQSVHWRDRAVYGRGTYLRLGRKARTPRLEAGESLLSGGGGERN